ncbi:DUSAM domain-containing protein [Archangium gephyra]|uniref:DUSAM domain-containing protein n=1 Tax=Archangium gephyra TaxID=48 RepID=UPI003B784E57
MSEEIDWNPIRALAQRVLTQGEPLELTNETLALLRKSAREVAISSEDAEDALRSQSTASTLLREIRQRIRDGSNRLMQALERAYTLREAGDLEGARREMEGVLAVEVVPLYRAQATDVLEDIEAGLF